MLGRESERMNNQQVHGGKEVRAECPCWEGLVG